MIEFLMNQIANLINKLNLIYIQNFTVILNSLLMTAGLTLLLLLVEIPLIGYDKSSIKKLISPTNSTLNDIILWFMTHTCLLLLVTLFFTGGIPFALSKVIRNIIYFNFNEFLSPVIHFSIYFILLDFIGYWAHRIMHNNAVLWQIHKYHHSASEMNGLTGTREHPLNDGINIFIRGFVLSVTGIPPEHYPYFVTTIGLWGLFKHTNMLYSLGWFGKYILQSPRDHWIHHSTEYKHHNTNFANNFAIWDHLFGTYYHGKDLNANVGLKKHSLNQGFLKDLITIQLDFFKLIILKTKSKATQLLR